MIALGGMGEWLKPTDLKSVKAATSSGVRIPLPPPEYQLLERYSFNKLFPQKLIFIKRSVTSSLLIAPTNSSQSDNPPHLSLFLVKQTY